MGLVHREGRLVQRYRGGRERRPEALWVEQVLLDQPAADRLRQVRQGERRQRRPGDRLWPLGRGQHQVAKQAAPLVVEPVDQRRGEGRAAEGQLRQAVQNVRDDLAHHRPALRQHRAARHTRAAGCAGPAAGSPAGPAPAIPRPRRTWAKRPGPTRRVARSRADRCRRYPGSPRASPVAHQARHLARVADRDLPCPCQQRRLDARGHQVARSDTVVEHRPRARERLPEDRVADEPVGPRGAQERLELGARPRRVEPPPGDGGEARIPVPLVRIAVRARAGVRVPPAARLALAPVLLEHPPALVADERQGLHRSR